MSIFQSLDALKAGETVMITREEHAPGGGIVVVTKRPKQAQRVFCAEGSEAALTTALGLPRGGQVSADKCPPLAAESNQPERKTKRRNRL